MFWVDSYYDHISQNRYTWLLIQIVIRVPNSDHCLTSTVTCMPQEYVHLEKKTPIPSPRGALLSSLQATIDVIEDLLFNMLPHISQPTSLLHIKSNLFKKRRQMWQVYFIVKKHTKAIKTRKKRAGKLLCTVNTRVLGNRCPSMKEISKSIVVVELQIM